MNLFVPKQRSTENREHIVGPDGSNAVMVLPNGVRKEKTPSSITFVGGLFAEDKVLAVAKAYQDATSFHLKHPVL